MSFSAAAYEEVAPGVARLRVLFVNLYFVDAPDGWVLVDTGVPGSAALIKRTAEKRYGEKARPRAIILTHGHFDHAGSAAELAGAWGCARLRPRARAALPHGTLGTTRPRTRRSGAHSPRWPGPSRLPAMT